LKVGNARFWLGENSQRIGYIRYAKDLAQFMRNSEEKKVIERFKGEVTRALGDRLDRIVLFGSRARGDADDESDFDFLVALRKVEKEDKDKIQKIASDLSLKYNIVITALVIPSEDFREDRYFYLYENIQKEGQVV
jgi:predicted nucleotidyltransferase